jgi:S23 ribosomal protein.
MTYHDFTEMPLWQKDMEIAVCIQKLTKDFPRNEDYGVTSQIRRASLSISGNIAEGFGRNHTRDKLNFYYFSRGSIMETRSHLIYCQHVNYISQEKFLSTNEDLLVITIELNKLIKALQSKL